VLIIFMKELETIANIKMNIEGMEKLVFINVHFNMNVGLENDNERERKKAITVYDMAQRFAQSSRLGMWLYP
jgi:hypothetical protein